MQVEFLRFFDEFMFRNVRNFIFEYVKTFLNTYVNLCKKKNKCMKLYFNTVLLCTKLV